MLCINTELVYISFKKLMDAEESLTDGLKCPVVLVSRHPIAGSEMWFLY